MVNWITISFKRLTHAIRHWYHGTHCGDPMFPMSYDYHWTAALLHRFIRWHKVNWFNFWMLTITALGVLVALIALIK